MPNNIISTGYIFTDRIRLMTWIQYGGNNVYAEITANDAIERTIEIYVPGHLYRHTMPMSAIQSVALKQGDKIIKAFGRPSPHSTPEWVEYMPSQEYTPKPPAASRPLIEDIAYFEKRFCDDCMIVHFVQVTRHDAEICRGENYYFDTLHKGTHFSRRLGQGFELIAYTRPATASDDADRDAELIAMHDDGEF
jgi:hypothetical protein